jgi:hypothetical protein
MKGASYERGFRVGAMTMKRSILRDLRRWQDILRRTALVGDCRHAEYADIIRSIERKVS